MPTLAQLSSTGTDPTLITVTDNIPVVEPLDGPTTVDDVMDRFPEEVYQQGRDTHLYRFLQALGGDSGAGLIKAQAYAARLVFEAEFLNFQVLDQFYAAQFRFKRLKSETYPDFDPSVDALTPTEWETIELADQSYKQRVADFFTATRYGTSPQGMALAAQAGSGIECEIVENYKWVFDQFSDDPLGLAPIGTTVSTSEFIVIPRFVNGTDAASVEFSQSIPFVYTFGTASLPNARPSLGGTGPTVTKSFGTTVKTELLPEIERNATDILDRLKSAGTLATIQPDQTRYLEVALDSTKVHASSERIHSNRLVTGAVGVAWPTPDPSKAYFIESGKENEAGYFYGSARELPIIFQTIEGVHAYTEQALSDPNYNTSLFFDNSTGISIFDSYRSEHYGPFSATLSAIFPVLANVSIDSAFTAINAPAINDTLLVLEGRAV